MISIGRWRRNSARLSPRINIHQSLLQASSFAITLPPEIWFYIAQFLSSEDRLNLRSVNHAFLEAALDEIDRELDFIHPNPERFVKLACRLKRPSVAARVRIIKLWPAALSDAIYRTPTIQRRLSTPMAHSQSSLDQPGQNAAHPPKDNASTVEHTRDRLGLYVGVLKQCIHVEECQIYWPHDVGSLELCLPLISPLLSMTGSKLHSLVLNLALQRLSVVLPPVRELCRQIQHLNIVIPMEPTPSGFNIQTVMSAAIEFINGLAPCLQSLTIMTRGHVDLSTFFEGLWCLLQLKKLHLTMPFDTRHFSDPEPLYQMLIRQPQLYELTIRDEVCCSFGTNRERVMTQCIQAYMSGSVPGYPKSLTIGLDTRHGTLISQAMGPPLICPNGALTSLTIVNHCFTFDEIAFFLTPFAYHLGRGEGLKSLSFFVHNLSPLLLDFLATHFINLESLKLDAENIVASECLAKDDPGEFVKAMDS